MTDSKLIQSNFVVGHQAIFPTSALLEVVDDRHDQVIFFSLGKIPREFTRRVGLEVCPDFVGLCTIHLGGKPPVLRWIILGSRRVDLDILVHVSFKSLKNNNRLELVFCFKYHIKLKFNEV
jgi:hypothetical protein